MQQLEKATEGTDKAAPEQKIAENPNPRANENIRHTPFDEKDTSGAASDVGTEITDGEGG